MLSNSSVMIVSHHLGREGAADILQPDGVSRIGLRYIDEIRVPGVSADAPADWEDWLDASLLAPRLADMGQQDLGATAWDGVAQYAVGENRSLNLRYGVRDGYAVPPGGPLRRKIAPPPGPFFVLDFDCSWTPTDIPEFDTDVLLSTCDELRRPVRILFDLLTTDRLRDEVFMKESPSD
jgi:uncharacterized protein (TIGR04255 family)